MSFPDPTAIISPTPPPQKKTVAFGFIPYFKLTRKSTERGCFVRAFSGLAFDCSLPPQPRAAAPLPLSCLWMASRSGRRCGHLRRGQELGRGCGAPLCQSPPRSTRGPALIGAVLRGVGRADPETRAQPRGEVSAPVLPSTIKSERAFFPAAASTWPSAPLRKACL